MANQRKGGKIQVQIGAVLQDAKGNWTYNLGHPKRESIVGADSVHGYKEMPQIAFVEGEITDRGTLDLGELVDTTATSITLTLANGKVIILREAWFAGEGTGNTEEGNIAVRFEGKSAEEVS